MAMTDREPQRVIRTPDQRLRIFISSTLKELEDERSAARDSVEGLRLIPVMFELGARPHPPRELYRSYLEQSHIFLGIYWERYGWIAPGESVSGLEDEYLLSGTMPKVIYIKDSDARDAQLKDLLDRIRTDDHASYKQFSNLEELSGLIKDDLALILTERFEMAGEPPPSTEDRPAGERTHATRVPISPTLFVGREDEAEHLRELLARDDIRLLTLTGPGGIGKSRLAFEVALQTEKDFADGMSYVLLGQVSDPALVLPRLAQEVGARESADRSVLDALRDFLADKEMLLVLDNFEHVLSVAPTLSELLAACAGLKILVTSRAALNLRGEHEYPIPTLELGTTPSTAAEALTIEAVKLFVDRAAMANPRFELTDQNAAVVAEICARLDGLPLAIELAAARVRLLSVESLLERLENRLDVLARGPRDLPERQQTLKALLDWDYDLLDDNERIAFRRLSVFAGGFTLPAAESTMFGNERQEFDILDVLEALLRKSLVREHPPLLDESRFGMLNMLREYARSKLDESGETTLVKKRHAEYFLALAERGSPRLREADQVEWLEIFEREHDNMRGVLTWAADNDESEIELRLAGALSKFWEFHAHLTEGQRWIEGALSRGAEAPAELRALCLDGAGVLARSQGEVKRANALLEESVALRRQLGDNRALAQSLRHLGSLTFDRGDLEATKRYYEESAALFKKERDEAGYAGTINNLGVLATVHERWNPAATLYEEALDFFRGYGDKQGIARALMNLGEVRMMQNKLEEAEEMLKESFVLFQEIGSQWDIAYVLEGLAHVKTSGGNPRNATLLLGAADALRETLGAPRPPNEVEPYEKHVARARAAMDEAAFKSAWDEGREMTIEAALKFALAD
jgi:predicted ATPase